MYKVIIAEDEMLVRIGLKNHIDWSRYNMKVIADVSNGKEAWEAYKKQRPHLLITDIKMPVLDGMGLIERIRKEDEQTQIVILTCVEEFDLVRSAIAFGVTDYLPKLSMKAEDLEQVLGKVQKNLDDIKTVWPSVDLSEDVLIEKLMKDYLFRQRYTADEFTALITANGFLFETERLDVAIIELDQSQVLMERFKDDSGQLVKMSMLNVLQEVREEFGTGIVTHDEDQRYLIIIGSSLSSDLEMDAFMRKYVEHIQSVMQMYFDITVSCAVSESRNGIKHMREQYDACRHMLTDKWIGKKGGFYIQPLAKGERDQALLEELRPFLNSLKTLKWHDGAMKQVTMLLNSSHISMDQMKSLFIHWLQRYVSNTAMGPLLMSEFSLRFPEKLDQCHFLSEMIVCFNEFMDLAEEENSVKTFNVEVIKAVQYIDKNYHRNINLSDVAAQVYMTPNYLSQLMKKELQMGFVEYLTNFRINVSKSLLLDLQLKSYEIAEKTGFADYSHFSRVFKKITGMSPREYRRSVFGEWSEDSRE